MRALISPAGNYILKVNNRNTRKRCEICSKLTIKTPDAFIVNFEHIVHLVSIVHRVSIVKSEQVSSGWEADSNNYVLFQNFFNQCVLGKRINF